MCDELHETGKCCGKCYRPEPQGCYVCGETMDTLTCDCGQIMCDEHSCLCDWCEKVFCEACFETAKEVGGGLGIGIGGWNMCYTCGENNKTQS